MRIWKIFFVALVVGAMNFANFFTAESSPTTENAIRTEPTTTPAESLVTPESILQGSYDTFKVGYVKNTGFLKESREGHKIGYGYEYMEFLANYAHCKFEYVAYDDWSDLLDKLSTGEVDLIPNMPGDYHQLQNATRTDHVIGRFPMEIVVGDGGAKPKMILGNLTTGYPTPQLAGVARGEGFEYDLVSYSRMEDMKKAFHRNEIDGYIASMTDPHSSENVLAMFDRKSYRLSVSSDRPDLLLRMNLAMDMMLLNQPNIRDMLNNKYLRAEGFPLILSRNEKNFLAEKKKLRAAIFMYKQPYAYKDKSGNLVGVVPEIIKKIGDDLNLEIEIVETKSLSETRALIQKGEIDFVADAVCDFSWAEEFSMNPTQPYLMLDYIPVTRADYFESPSANPTVAVCKSMLYTADYVEPNYPKENILYLSTFEETLQAVNNGQADIAFVYRDSFHSLIESAGTYTLEAGAASVYSEQISLGVFTGEDPQLWHILNKEINHIDVEWVRDALNRNQQTVAPFSLKRAIHHHPFRAMAVLSLIALAVGGFLFYRHKMNQRHFELVQHMAYTDLRYDLPNVPWLELNVPPAFDKIHEENPAMKTFFVAFSLISGAVIIDNHGHKIIDKQFQLLAAYLAKVPHVIFTAAGVDVDHLICFCKAESPEKIIDWAESIIKEYSYMETADAGAKVILHTRAGISNYDRTTYVQQAVDRALTACHKNTADEVKFFDEKLEESLTSQHNIESRMEQALKDDEFKAWYQPKYDIKTRRIIGAEALVRWISPETGFMPPGKFIPLFEQNGFVIQVDYHILEKTFQLQKERLDAGKEVVPISVNQSRLHMTEDGYLDKIRAIVEKYNLPPGLIELEITETMFGDFDAKTAQQNAENIIRELHGMGFTISVDDFGSGYSSFSLLGKLPMDVMKIDRSILTGADTSQRMREILGNVIKLGHSLSMKVLCEGIETTEQENLLLELGCRYGQGFLNAKPMPVDDFINFFEKRNAEVDAAMNA